MRYVTMRGGFMVGLGLVSLAAVGCGGGSSGPQSYAEAKALIDSPSGTVDATTVGPVAKAFEASISSAPAGIREKAQAADASAICTGGGSASVDASGDQNSGTARVSYNNCCISTGTGQCCYNGTASTFYNGGATNYCASYDLSLSCAEVLTDLNMSLCFTLDGTTTSIVYAVTVDGETFAVEGSYAAGNGTLTIRGANGEWTCTYTNDAGSCTGTGGDFTF